MIEDAGLTTDIRSDATVCAYCGEPLIPDDLHCPACGAESETAPTEEAGRHPQARDVLWAIAAVAIAAALGAALLAFVVWLWLH